MTDKELFNLLELKGMVDAMVTLAQNDTHRAADTLTEMGSGYYQGYYTAEAAKHRFYAERLQRILDFLTAITQEAQDA